MVRVWWWELWRRQADGVGWSRCGSGRGGVVALAVVAPSAPALVLFRDEPSPLAAVFPQGVLARAFHALLPLSPYSENSGATGAGELGPALGASGQKAEVVDAGHRGSLDGEAEQCFGLNSKEEEERGLEVGSRGDRRVEAAQHHLVDGC